MINKSTNMSRKEHLIKEQKERIDFTKFLYY